MMVTARSPVATRKLILSIQTTVGSSAGGVMSGAFGMDPSGAAEWSSAALLYDQFRVLGGQMKIACTLAPNTAAVGGIIRLAFDNDSATTPASYADVMEYSEVSDFPAVWTSGTIRTFNFRRPVVNGLPQSQQVWYNETAPSASPGGIKFFGSGLSASTVYWSVILDYLVEFQIRS